MGALRLQINNLKQEDTVEQCVNMDKSLFCVARNKEMLNWKWFCTRILILIVKEFYKTQDPNLPFPITL